MDDSEFIKNYKKKQETIAEERETSASREKAAPAAVLKRENENKNENGGGESAAPLRYEQKSEFKPPKKDGMEERARIRAMEQRRRMIFAGVFTAIIVVSLIGLIFVLKNPSVKVPDFTSWKMTEVQAWFEQNNKIILKPEPVFNDEIDENCVISQGTPPNAKVKKGDIITLEISKGHDMSRTYPLPDFMNMTREEVEKWSGERFMSKVRITTESNDKIAVGKVIRFEINDNTVVNEVRRDTPIYIIVSKGPEEAAAVKVPDFKGGTEEACRAFADEKGITLIVVKEYSDSYPDGVVYDQSVKAEQTMQKGDELTVTVSKGKKIIMPDFSGLSKEAASAKAAEAGINVIIADAYSASKKAGDFISQSKGKGTVYNPEDIVELKYSLGNTVAVPSFTGQSESAINEWAAELIGMGAKITVKTVSTQNPAPKGTIIHQDIENANAAIDAVINIIVSLGFNCYVPDFVAPANATYENAVTIEEAIRLCEQANLIPVFTAEENNGRLPGEIWKQDIPAGKEVPEKTVVTLTYRPVTGSLAVPDFTGKTEEQVRAGGHMRQFNIAFASAEYVPGFENKVCNQSVRAGSSAAPGTLIILYIPDASYVPDPEPEPNPEPWPEPPTEPEIPVIEPTTKR